MQDDLGVLRIILVSTVVQGLTCPGETDGGDKLQVEPGPTEMVRQGAVIIAGRLKPDPNRQVVADECLRQS